MFKYSNVYDIEDDKCVLRYDMEKDKKYEELEVIASWGICNTASLNVFKIEDSRVLIGINDQQPEWYDIDSYVDEDWEDKDLEDEYNLGVEYGGSVYFLDECMRV